MLRSLVVRLLCGIMLFSGSFSVFAGPPSPPAGMPNGGLFARYFSNIVGGSLGTGSCPAGQVIVGFSTGAGINYGVPVCITPSSLWQQNGSSIYYNAGNVGIGTNSPAGPLHIVSNSDSPLILQTSDNTWLYTQWLQSNGTRRAWVGLNNDLSAFNIALENGTNSLIIPSGNVGIGTSSPISPLQINNGPGMTAGYNRALTLYSNHPTIQFKGISDTNHSAFIGYDAQNASEGLRFWVAGTTDDVGNAINAMNIHKSGNVGIGTSIPGAKLDIIGSIKISDGTQGAGKVLQSDTNGLASWQSISTLPSAGTAGQTLYSNGSAWVASQNIYNNGGNVGIGTTSPSWKLDVAGDIQANGGWFRVKGTNGIYWQDYGPGWYAQDATWLRTYNNASIWANNGNIGTNGSFTAGYGGTAGPAGGAIFSANVGIGTSSPSTRLQVGDGGDGWTNGLTIYSNYPTIYMRDADERGVMIHNNSNLLYFLTNCNKPSNNPSGGNTWCTQANGYWPLYLNLNNNNAVFGAGVYAFNYYYNSDRNFKKDITSISGALSKIEQLDGRYFTWKDSGKKDIGLIAQEVQKVFPEIVEEQHKVDPYSNKQGDKYLTVEYGNLVAPLIEATKELSAQNKAQQQEIDDLKKEVEELKSLISHK